MRTRVRQFFVIIGITVGIIVIGMAFLTYKQRALLLKTNDEIPEVTLSTQELITKYHYFCDLLHLIPPENKKELESIILNEKRYDLFYGCWAVDIQNHPTSMEFNINTGKVLFIFNGFASDKIKAQEPVKNSPEQNQGLVIKKVQELLVKLIGNEFQDFVLTKANFEKSWPFEIPTWHLEWKRPYGQYLSLDSINIEFDIEYGIIRYINNMISQSPAEITSKFTKEEAEKLAIEYAKEVKQKTLLPDYFTVGTLESLKIVVAHTSHIPRNIFKDCIFRRWNNAEAIQNSRLVWVAVFRHGGTGMEIWIDAITGKLIGGYTAY